MSTPHNSAQMGDFAKTVLLPGDPLRAKYIADKYLTDAFARQKVLGLAKKGQGAEAMAEAEKLLMQNPLDPNNIECAVKAAEAAGKPEAAAITIEAAYECGNNDPTLLERVVRAATAPLCSICAGSSSRPSILTCP